jgi:hypothetical protein
LAASLACADLAMLIITGNSVWGDTRDWWSLTIAALCVLASGKITPFFPFLVPARLKRCRFKTFGEFPV